MLKIKGDLHTLNSIAKEGPLNCMMLSIVLMISIVALLEKTGDLEST
jgi:hypothetical protein